MIPVTSAFKAASTATKRQAKAKVEIIWTDPFVDPFLNVESTDKNYGITVAESLGADILMQLVDNIDTPSYKYCILDGSWELGDDKVLAPCTPEEVSNFQIGWYSDSVADANGVIDCSVKVNFDLAGRIVTNVRVIGDSLLNQFPVDFTVSFYGAGYTLLGDPIEITGNTLLAWSRQFDSIDGVIYMVLNITKWNTPNTVVKILEFFSLESDVFEGDTIVSLDILEEREAKNGSSPIGNVSLNELTLKLQNIKIVSGGVAYYNPFTYGNSENNRFYDFLKPNRRINAYYGFKYGSTVEYVKMGTFWTKGDWRCNEMDFSTTVSAYDRMGLLKNVTFECPEPIMALENVTLKYLAELVLNHAKANIPLQDLRWYVGNDLESYTVTKPWFGKGTYFDAIRLIAEACLGCAWMSKDDVLYIRSYTANVGGVSVLSITRDDYFDKNQPSNVDSMKNFVEVSIQSITKSEEKEAVYSDKKLYTVAAEDEETFELSYNNTPVSDTEFSLENLTGSAAIKSIQRFTYGCRITIENTGLTESTFNISVLGYTYALNSDLVVSSQDDDLITEYGRKELKYENNLVQDETTAQFIADVLVGGYGTLRRDVNLKWRGDPSIEVGDTVTVPEYENNTADFVVIKNDWSFDGALSCNTQARKLLGD